jgi:hypothetical protein
MRNKKNPLPKPKHRLGYSSEEIKAICKAKNIKEADFNEAFGCNTCAVAEDGKPRFYVCDVERALYNLGHSDGVYHEWD